MDIKRIVLEIKFDEKSIGEIYVSNEGKINLFLENFEIEVSEWEELSTVVNELILVMKKIHDNNDV